jgi:hypothetical protein
VIHDEDEGGTDQEADKRAHIEIVARRAVHFK